MKLNGTSSSVLLNGTHNHDKQINVTTSEQTAAKEEQNSLIGDNHVATSIDTPLREDAFEMSDEEKMEKIAYHFEHIMHTLGLDLTDDSLQGTPNRVAKMYIKEVFKGLDPKNKPAIRIFDNKYGYNQMLVEKDISFHSHCEHHFVPIVGKAHIAYISNGGVIGLSKLHRTVDYFARRPQVQERLTNQIGEELQKILGTSDVAVVIDAAHMCVSMRGIQDQTSTTLTTFYGGKFNEESTRQEFLKYLEMRPNK